MNYKGIILSGGLGTRLSPITKVVNKQLLPLFDKPLIYYPFSILMLANIKDILIIVRAEDIELYKKLFGDGSRIGIKITYAVQDKPSGIPEALVIGKKFTKQSNVALILGDNFFYGQGLSGLLEDAKKENNGATIFCYAVSNPSSFGVADIKKGRIISLKEKPKKTKSNLAISGLYFFDKNASDYASKLKKSKRKETEIIDLIKIYLKRKKLKYKIMGRGASWLDTGTVEGLFEASNYIYNIEKRQGLKIACLEEIAFDKGWINKKILQENIKFYQKSSYADYLRKIF
jgi:glucose-1-phosphate thymidylyltransferase